MSNIKQSLLAPAFIVTALGLAACDGGSDMPAEPETGSPEGGQMQDDPMQNDQMNQDPADSGMGGSEPSAGGGDTGTPE
ncbi:hypothetical protein P1P91_13300 [Halomonas piscis]|uniref:Lipoprotein n=1 Tax=Halomonas piscis TaxID=3031727 RepID=A0ABY9YYE6_9GAMM|nr:hypothetical protein [Halomonas piscis]WNK19792.1 hypothetical protein P1P91_13300 [Halomonas piscis]